MLINDLSIKTSFLRKDIEEAIGGVLKRSWFVLGPEVENFEKHFAEYIGVSCCSTVANGTDALELALRGLGVQSGDFVATVANAGFYTSTALLAIGAQPFYLDVNLEIQLVSFEEIERAIKHKVKAIIVTHLYGRAIPEIAKIAELCCSAKISLIEDCAQAHGAKIEGKQVGSFGDVGCFSFYPTKNLGALGDGGAIVCNNRALMQEVNRLRQYGWSSKYQVEVLGARNSRLDEMQAAILNVFLPHLDQWNLQRRAIAKEYSTHIKHSEIIVPAIEGENYVAHLYVVRSSKREVFREHLKKLGIATEIHYPIPDYRQPIFNSQYSAQNFLNTESLSKEIFTIPCYPEMSQKAVKHVIEAINHCP